MEEGRRSRGRGEEITWKRGGDHVEEGRTGRWSRTDSCDLLYYCLTGKCIKCTCIKFKLCTPFMLVMMVRVILEASSLPLHQRGPNAISLYTIALKKNLLFL